MTLEAVYNTVCTKCNGKGHIASECFNIGGTTYELIGDEDYDLYSLGDKDRTGNSSFEQVKAPVGRGRGATLPSWMTDDKAQTMNGEDRGRDRKRKRKEYDDRSRSNSDESRKHKKKKEKYHKKKKDKKKKHKHKSKSSKLEKKTRKDKKKRDHRDRSHSRNKHDRDDSHQQRRSRSWSISSSGTTLLTYIVVIYCFAFTLFYIQNRVAEVTAPVNTVPIVDSEEYMSWRHQFYL